jgi:hypothetical protein
MRLANLLVDGDTVKVLDFDDSWLLLASLRCRDGRLLLRA